MDWLKMTFYKILDLVSSFFNKNVGVKSTTVAPNTSIQSTESTVQVENTNVQTEKQDELNLVNIPERKPNAVTGSEFINNNMHLSGATRELNILKEFQDGNIPDFLRNLIPIIVKNESDTIEYYVMADYLSIGTNQDYCRIPMNPLTARKIADQYGCILPTKKMVDDIYKNASIKLEAKPHGPPYDHTMESTARFDWSNKVIQSQLVGKQLGLLVAGHKKDVVIGKPLLVKKHIVAIYGWFSNGKPIQGPTPNYSSHNEFYSDYSHGIRLISRKVMVNNNQKDIYDVLNNDKLSKLLSDEGPFDATTIYK
jgi:hypothetical protein